jgi:hypothetical protein
VNQTTSGMKRNTQQLYMRVKRKKKYKNFDAFGMKQVKNRFTEDVVVEVAEKNNGEIRLFERKFKVKRRNTKKKLNSNFFFLL